MASLIEKAKTAADIIMNFKKYCTYGQTLAIPEGVETVGMNVFHKDEGGGYGDNYLTHLELPSTLKSINFRSFAGNTKLAEVVIPHGCEYIYSQAFMGCVSIQRLYLPNTIKSCYYQAFLPNSNMTVFEVEEGFSSALDVSFTNANLSAEVMVNVFNNLADLAGQSAKTLVFGTTNLNKLTLEQIAIATNKNWNLS